ncbi:conjugal transfer protein TraN [Acinetobacter pittii]|uniref:conjugal transfer protein TraN n=1 Tax=Acinetobacter pittii TaxID=48296 RepID=UPI00355B8BBE
MKKFLSTSVLLCITSLVYAASANDEGKEFAKSMLEGNLKDISNSLNTNQVPNYQENVPEKNLTHDQLESKAYEKLSTDQASKDNANMLINRQTYKLDTKNDPLIKNYRNIEQGAAELIASNYTGCTNVKYGADSTLSNLTKSCKVSIQQTREFDCTATYYNQCMNPKAGIPNTITGNDIKVVSQQSSTLHFQDNGNGNFSFRSDRRYTGCGWFIDEIQFEAKDASAIKKLVLSNFSYDDGFWIDINGEQVFSIIGSQVNPPNNNWSCEQNREWQYSAPIDLTSKVRKGLNVIRIRNIVGDQGDISFNMKIERVEACDINESYKRTCSVAGANPLAALLQSKTCKNYIINKEGKQVCGTFEEKYKTSGDPFKVETEESSCSTIRESGCFETKTECVKELGGVCIEKRKLFSCNSTNAAKSVSVCGSQLICPDGNCTSDVGRDQVDATADFKEAATKLETAGQLVKEITTDKLSIFKGTGRKCTDKALGFSNCCKDSGWGMDIGLAQCSSDEKELGLSRQTARAHFVGSYSKGTIIKTKYQSFCTFPSKLTRILVEQGRAQLGWGWGSPENPDCSGFTLQQIESLDFNKMDLSEFYNDVMDKANNGTTPSNADAVDRIKESLNNRFGGNN